jgi:hypothetical protein
MDEACRNYESLALKEGNRGEGNILPWIFRKPKRSCQWPAGLEAIWNVAAVYRGTAASPGSTIVLDPIKTVAGRCNKAAIAATTPPPATACSVVSQPDSATQVPPYFQQTTRKQKEAPHM